MIAQQIAIDGPAGAGKSSVSKRVADRLGYLYIDTGAMYRAIALLALRAGVPFDDETALTALAEHADLQLHPAPGGCRVMLNGEDVSEKIRLPEVGNAASPVSACGGVRKALVAMQQAMAKQQQVVMDGRDIGTVVLPDAACKIFLTAAPRERAKRRALELEGKGLPVDIDAIEQEIAARDHRDSTRSNSPLRQAEDAVLVDNSNMTIEQTVEKIIALAGAAK